MRDDAYIVLEQKIEEIKRDFEKWIIESRVLIPGEFAVIDIRIEKTPIVVTKVTKKKSWHPKYSTKELEQKDWDKIFSIPFSKTERAILKMIHQNNNQPTSREEISSNLEKQLGPRHSRIREDYLSLTFSTMNFPYRLKECSKENRDDKSCMKMFIIENNN